MANPDQYADFVEFNVSIVPGSLIGASLARCCLISTFATTTAFPTRRKVYSGTAEQVRKAVFDDGFALTSVPYKQVFAFTNNVKPVNEVVLGRADAGDASLTASLTAIFAEDDTPFGFCVDTRNKVSQLEAFQFAQQKKNKWYLTYTSDALALDENTFAGTLPSQIEALDIEWGMCVWYNPTLATKYGPAVVTSKAGTFKVPHNGTLKLRVAGGGEQTFTFPSAAATVTGGDTEPFNVVAATTFKIKINGGSELTVTFPNNIAAATATQVAEIIQNGVSGIVAEDDGNGAVKLSTTKRGTGASIEITASTIATLLDLTVDTYEGTGFAADADAATGTEVAAKIQATITSAAAAATGAKFKITSTASGDTAKIQITGGTLVDEFGLELGLTAGIGTQENYLDCQLLGRIASFDLDAPDGSVGFDNQTVPQTPGNTITNTQRKVLWGHSCNTYEAVTNNRPGELHPGLCPRGFDADVVWSAFWFRVRGTERVKAMQDAMADQGLRIPYEESGVAKYSQVLRALMLDGARNGHIQGPDLQPKDPLGVRTTYFLTPTIAQQKPSDRAQGIISGFDTLQLSRGSAKKIVVNMQVQTP
jgi:hypothetical protein